MTDVFDHPWLGGLFESTAASDIWRAKRQLTHMIRFEAALTRAMGHAGTLQADTANTVADQIEAFSPDMEDLRAGTARDGLPVPALVKQLRAHVGANAKAVHTGSTSQDVMDTALALTIQSTNQYLDRQLVSLADRLESLTDQFRENPMMGRTRMQAALPITVADRVVTWANPLGDHRTRLAALRPQTERLQFGGAVGDRAAFGAHADAIAAHMAAALGLGNPSRAWHTTRESLVEWSGLLSLISGTLGKLGQDICLMAQQGVNEIAMTIGGGSSAMPHKQNPIAAELLVTLARYNATQVSAMHHALVHEQERSGTAWALEWMILPQMAQTTARGLEAAITLCDSITSIGTPSA